MIKEANIDICYKCPNFGINPESVGSKYKPMRDATFLFCGKETLLYSLCDGIVTYSSIDLQKCIFNLEQVVDNNVENKSSV